MPERNVDYSIENHGTIYLVKPFTNECTQWLRDNVPDDSWFGVNLVVGHRYIENLTDALAAEGFYD